LILFNSTSMYAYNQTLWRKVCVDYETYIKRV